MAGIRVKPGKAAFLGEKIPGIEALQVVLALLLTSCVTSGNHFPSLGLGFPSYETRA